MTQQLPDCFLHLALIIQMWTETSINSQLQFLFRKTDGNFSDILITPLVSALNYGKKAALAKMMIKSKNTMFGWASFIKIERLYIYLRTKESIQLRSLILWYYIPSLLLVCNFADVLLARRTWTDARIDQGN